MALTTTQQVQAAYLQINRVALNDAAAAAVAASIDGGVTTFATYQAGLIAQAATTTTAAFALSTFIEGVVPTSARIDSLTAFAKTQFDYYTNTLKSANAQLGAYEALGKAFAADPTTTASFAARYGALSATDFVTAAYASIFNNSPVPSAGALANLVSQVAYFTDIYTKAGIPAADAALQAKGAVLGQIIGYASTGSDLVNGVDPSTFDQQIEAQINTAANEARAETTPSTVYGVGTLGLSIDLAVGLAATAVSPSAVATRTTTQFGDKVSGTLGTLGFTDALKIDGGAGVDSLTVTTAAGNTAYAPVADIIKSIEKLTVVSAVASTADVTNVKGLTDFTLGAASVASLAVTGLDTATNVHVTTTAANLTVGYASAPAAAKISVDGNYTGDIAFSDAAVKTVTANVTVASSGVNFADNDLTGITVTSKGDVSINNTGTGLKTLDLSGVGTFSKVNLGGEGLANAVTATLGKGADVFEIDANKAHQITLGAGADTVEINQLPAGHLDVTDAAKLAASAVVIKDFSKADADILRLDGTVAVRTALDATQLGQIAASADIKAAATAAGAITGALAADSWAIFNFGTDSYAYYDFNNDGLTATDTLVKVTGFAVADLTATNLFIV
jgi:hypothetical protein